MAGPSSTVTRTNVLAGPGQLWYGVYPTATFPADTAVNLGVAASAGWTDAGGTDGGLTVTTNQSFFDKRVDQIPDSLGKVMTERAVQVSTSLAEGTLENLALALNVDPADITSGAGFKKLSLVPGQAAMIPDEFSVIVDGWAPGTAKRRRALIRRVNSIENVESAYQKDGLWLIPVTFEALYVDSVTSPVAWVDEVGA